MNQDFFTQLYDEDYNLSSLFVMRQNWNRGYRFTMTRPRPTDAFLLFADCEAICEREGQTFKVPRGALVHMAKSSTYAWEFLTEDEKAHPLLFEFSMTDTAGAPLSTGEGVNVLFTDRFELFEKYFLRLLDEFSRPKRSPGAVKAAAYRLLANVIQHKYRETSVGVDTRLIAKGIAYLEEDPRQEKSIAEVASLCNVSVNYFERLFKQYAGETPSEYRARMKIERAKLLIGLGIMTLGQIADELGFGDSAYLCRVFRKKTGMTPKEYRALHLHT